MEFNDDIWNQIDKKTAYKNHFTESFLHISTICDFNEVKTNSFENQNRIKQKDDNESMITKR